MQSLAIFFKPVSDRMGRRLKLLQQFLFDSKLGSAQRRKRVPAEPVGIGLRGSQPSLKGRLLSGQLVYQRHKLVQQPKAGLLLGHSKYLGNNPSFATGILQEIWNPGSAMMSPFRESKDLRTWTGSDKHSTYRTVRFSDRRAFS